MKRTRIKSVSDKRKAELEAYHILEDLLREFCGNKSELSGDYADWQTHWDVEGHHIDGRNGERLLDPFNIIMLTRNEHTNIAELKSKEELLQGILLIRIHQGFKEVNK